MSEMVLAAGSSRSATDWLTLALFGAVAVGGLTLTVVRVARSMKPRKKQMAKLAAELNGRQQVYIRMIENGLAIDDLAWVARSRGYSLIVHRHLKYYEFVYTPYQPGRVA